MARPARPWFRFYVEAMSDRKLRRLPVAERWLWVAVLAAARQSPRPGFLLVANGFPMGAEDLADIAALRLRVVRPGLVHFEDLGMIEKVDGCLRVCAWDARQYESDDVTARTRKHRSREQVRNVPTTFPGTPPETETETETEQPPLSPPLEVSPTATALATIPTLDAVPHDSRGHRLPEQFNLSPNMRDWAAKNAPNVNLTAATAKFADYWRSQPGVKGRKTDWVATWRNWIRREAENTTNGRARAPTKTEAVLERRPEVARILKENL